MIKALPKPINTSEYLKNILLHENDGKQCKKYFQLLLLCVVWFDLLKKHRPDAQAAQETQNTRQVHCVLEKHREEFERAKGRVRFKPPKVLFDYQN